MADRFAGRSFNGDRHKGQRIGTLFWSDARGEADVTLSELFECLGHVARVDALQDVIGLLQRERDEQMQRGAQEWNRLRKARADGKAP